jgi:hypothetical protein
MTTATAMWIIALTVIIVWKIFTRGIDLSGLLQGDAADGSTYFSPGRVQLLVFTVLFAVHLLTQIMAHPRQFPPIPHEYLIALGASQAVYLGGKARAMLS